MIHRNLIEGTTQILHDILFREQTADSTLQQYIQSYKKWGSRDRRLIQSTVYDFLRNYLLIQNIFNRHTLSELVESYMNRPEVLKESYDQLPYPIRYSIPEEMDHIGKNSLGAAFWEKEMAAMHQAGSIFLRINIPIHHSKKITSELDEKEIPYQWMNFEAITHQRIKISFPCMQLFSNVSPKTFTSFQNGWVDFQDPGSQAIIHFAAPTNKDTIVDGCCGNGGKSTGMMLLAPQATYYCMDVSENKLKQLGQRIQRLGLKPATLNIAVAANIQPLKEKADLVLLDVPCSGSGTIRRQAELKYKINRSTLDKTLALQLSILELQSQMVKPGGKLIYSTCSIFKEENMEMIESFISRHPSFILKDYLSLLPSEGITDGFFMASLERK